MTLLICNEADIMTLERFLGDDDLFRHFYRDYDRSPIRADR